MGTNMTKMIKLKKKEHERMSRKRGRCRGRDKYFVS